MSFKISNFKSEINRTGFLRSHSGVCNFSTPRGLLSKHADNRSILIRCDSTSLPGIGFATDDIRRYGYGPVERRPHTPLFDPIPLSFIIDAKGELYEYFYNWFNLISNHDSTSSMTASNAPYQVEYKTQYTTDISTYVYNETNKKVINISMIDAWPIAMSETPLSWADSDNIIRLNVVFSYKEWVMKSSETSLLDDVLDIVSSSKSINNSSRVAKFVIDTLINKY